MLNFPFGGLRGNLGYVVSGALSQVEGQAVKLQDTFKVILSDSKWPNFVSLTYFSSALIFMT